jgi:aldehyde dehydrogenase (NAD+)
MPDFGAPVSRYRDYSHGEWGFRAYTNAGGVLYHSTRLDLGVRYPPYDRNQALRRTLAHLGS